MNGLDASLETNPELVVARQLLHQAYRNLLSLAERADPAHHDEVVQLYRNVLRWLADCRPRIQRPEPPRVCDLARLHMLMALFQAGDDESLRVLSVDATERAGLQTIDWFLTGRTQALELVVDPAAHAPSIEGGAAWIEVQLVRRADGWIDVTCRDAGPHDHVALFVALRYFFNTAPSRDGRMAR